MYKLIKVTRNGTIQTLYSDDLARLAEKGHQTVTRASNVEPAATGRGWDVVLTDAEQNGRFKAHVVARNVPLRAEALRLEVEFIQEHILGVNANAK
ncbi:MAG: hypothetical protein GZ088_09470 [Acidipila sp.]|nr:hypothetical protein [Acidipila sp.]